MEPMFVSGDGWLSVAERHPSPNFNARPVGEGISLLVIHNISLPPGEFGNGYVKSFFSNHLETSLHPYFKTIAQLKVSSHLFIERSGHIVQFVPFDQRAWHAGVSQFGGVDNCNNYSIGIELEGCDDVAYTDPQYQALSTVTRHLLSIYPKITPDRIVGHNQIAPGRKTDPGPAFDWSRYHSLLDE